jgi:hypothetical protein
MIFIKNLENFSFCIAKVCGTFDSNNARPKQHERQKINRRLQ